MMRMMEMVKTPRSPERTLRTLSRVLNSLNEINQPAFFECPVCDSSMLVRPSKQRIDASCQCDFQTEEQNLRAIADVCASLGRCDTKPFVKLVPLPNSVLARTTNGIIEVNEKYHTLVNSLDVGFDRVLFWLYTLSHEVVHLRIEENYRKVSDIIRKTTHDANWAADSSDDTIVLSLKRQEWFFLRALDAFRRHQEKAASRSCLGPNNTWDRIACLGFVHVYNKLPIFLQQTLRKHLPAKQSYENSSSDEFGATSTHFLRRPQVTRNNASSHRVTDRFKTRRGGSEPRLGN
jgi:hypothetical protein